MACQDCNQNIIIPSFTPLPGCPGCGSGCSDNPCPVIVDTTCIVYTGPNLTCAGITTNMCLELALQKIDSQICGVTGNYASFNLSCLRSIYTINTEQQFAESISAYVCQTRADLTGFINDTFPSEIAELQAQINSINSPGITSCAQVGIIGSDTLSDVLDKLTTAACTLYSNFDLSAVNWSQCMTVTVPPTTLVEAFNVVIQQICTVNGSTGTVLPTFNNTGTCLATPGTTDSLVDTIIKIRTRLCQSPTFNAGNLASSDCVTFTPSSTLEQVIDAQNTAIDTISQSAIRATSSDFILQAVDAGNPCLGMRISLASGVVDRLVALNPADLTPGTLFEKIAPGANISLDFGTTNPGKLTISASGGTPNDEKVKATAGDPTPGFLVDKLTGGTESGVTIGVNVLSPGQLGIVPSINIEDLVNAILDEAENNETIKARLCALISTCPSPCDPPSNVQVTYVP